MSKLPVLRSAGRCLAQQGEGQDRIKIIHDDSREVSAVLADGGGSVIGGDRAADLVVKALAKDSPEDFAALFDRILELDLPLKLDHLAGFSTVVSIDTDCNRLNGPAVGDSDALLVREGKVSNLAPEKELKPLLGDGEAFPTVFSGSLEGSVLLLCSDGLSKYVAASDVVDICSRHPDPSTIVDELIEAVSLPDGKLQDDVSVIVISQ